MPMDVLDGIIALERKRAENRRMNELLRASQLALQEKTEGCEMLKSKKQSMLADEAAKHKLVDEFMLFLQTIDRNHMETAQSFDEKAMMTVILTMMNGGGDHSSGHNGGFAGSN